MKIISLLICSLILLQSSQNRAFSQTVLEKVQRQFVSDPALSNASIGILAIDLKTGEKLLDHQPQISLPTASTVKLFATAGAIELLGENYKPKTRIYIGSKLDKAGTVEGDLWIRGGGDASLGSKYFNAEGSELDFMKKWADTLYQLGIRKITGSVIADASEFGYRGAPEGWTWNDMGNYYGAGPSGLPFYDNMLKYYFKINSSAGSTPELLKTFPVVENLNFKNYILASSAKGDNSYIYGAPYSLERFGTGFLQMNTTIVVKGSLPDPELQFAVELTKAFLDRGIVVEQAPKGVRNMHLMAAWKRYSSGPILIYTHVGESVGAVAKWTNFKSVNLFAEQLVCLAGYAKNGDGSTENGVKQLDNYFTSKFSTEGLYLKDGSGLSRSNGVSAAHFCSLLKYMHQSSTAKEFRATLPVAGESGTISDLCRGQAGHGRIRAKSGTMSRIKSYAGYIDSKTGKEIAFAIIVNNFNCSSNTALTKIEMLLNTLAIQ